MTAQSFDHERLDVDRLSIDYVARSFEASQSLEGLHRHARDQWLRAAQSIPRNIAEGNGKRSLKVQDDAAMKAMLHRIVAMLTRMAMKFDGVAEYKAEYDADIDYDYEHRFAEHEHGTQTEETPEPWDATERRW
jgi:hypothetical protein